MGSESGNSVGDRVNTSVRSCSSIKKVVRKVPRKIHKAEREKMKRDHMNELFLDLGRVIDLDPPNNGKASLLRETIKILGELIAQVESLKKENDVLLSESNYVAVEKNELLEDTSALGDQIKNLNREIDEKANYSNIDVCPPLSSGKPQLQEDLGHSSDSVPIVGPLFVLPLHDKTPGFPGLYPHPNTSNIPPSVTRPQARYPSSSDSWPSHILTNQTNVVTEDV